MSVFCFALVNSSSRYLFFTKWEPARVRCVYAFALDGSIDGEVPQIIELLAFGAIASRWALRLPVPCMSGASPRSSPSWIDSWCACSLIVLKTSQFNSLASWESKGILFLCNSECQPIAPSPRLRSWVAEYLAREISSPALSIKNCNTLSK